MGCDNEVNNALQALFWDLQKRYPECSQQYGVPQNPPVQYPSQQPPVQDMGIEDMDVEEPVDEMSYSEQSLTPEIPSDYMSYSNGAEIEADPEILISGEVEVSRPNEYMSYSNGATLNRPEVNTDEYMSYSNGATLIRPDEEMGGFGVNYSTTPPGTVRTYTNILTDTKIWVDGMGDHWARDPISGSFYKIQRQDVKKLPDEVKENVASDIQDSNELIETLSDYVAVFTGSILKPDDGPIVLPGETNIYLGSLATPPSYCTKWIHTGEGTLKTLFGVSLDEEVCYEDKRMVIGQTLNFLSTITQNNVGGGNIFYETLMTLQEANPAGSLIDLAQAYMAMGYGQWEEFIYKSIDAIPVIGGWISELFKNSRFYQQIKNTVLPYKLQKMIMDNSENAMTITALVGSVAPPVALLLTMGKMCIQFGRGSWDRAVETLLGILTGPIGTKFGSAFKNKMTPVINRILEYLETAGTKAGSDVMVKAVAYMRTKI